ncbi:MAG: cytochrome C oxidase subunit IV family protein [Balneolaceae bacterium]
MSGHHISSSKLLWTVMAGLLFLTFLTIAVTWFHIPSPWNIVVGVGIAIMKATLVAMFFMNLYWDNKFNSLMLIVGILFILLLFGITLLDTMFRNDPVPLF